jgi:hypothetical protein
MTALQRIGAEIIGGLVLIAAVLIWWNVHNRTEQKLGAAACIQSTTIDKTEAHTDVAKDQAAAAVDINAVVAGYETKVLSLSRSNDDLARRLSTSGAVCPSRVSDPGRAASANAADAGLAGGKSEAKPGPPAGGELRTDLNQLLGAGDAAQVKSEDCAKLYNGVRDRAIAAAAALPK